MSSRLRLAMAALLLAVRPAWSQSWTESAAGEIPLAVPKRLDRGPELLPDTSAAVREALVAEPLPPAAIAAPGPLGLAEVLNSILNAYPLLAVAVQGQQAASGDLLAAEGAFDLNVKGHAVATPMGFYQYYRYNLGLEQPTMWGGNVFAGYQLGRGFYPDWYGYWETNQGGELRAGFSLPLLKDRPIDQRRAELRKAALALDQTNPQIVEQRIAFVRAGSIAYWDWVAAGRSYGIARDLVTLADTRDAGLRRRLQEGDISEQEYNFNRRLIVNRLAKLAAADRKFQQTAIKLSLFLRDDQAAPVVPPAQRLPPDFPLPAAPRLDAADADIGLALAARPELQVLTLANERAAVDLAYAKNLLLPKLDWMLYNAKDVGLPTPKGDKTAYQLETGVYLDVPLQRRQAEGKLRAAQAKLTQIRYYQQFQQDKVAAEVRDAISALTMAHQQWLQTRENVRLAREVENGERQLFEAGQSTLINVNLQEQAAADAAILEIEALADYFRALADYRAALAFSGY